MTDWERVVREHMDELTACVDGFVGVGTRRISADRTAMEFRWFADPNRYELASANRGGSWSWSGDAAGDLQEELDTGFLARVVKTRDGDILRANLDGDIVYGTRRDNIDIGAVLEYTRHLKRVGLNTKPGLALRRDGTLLDWWAAYRDEARAITPLAHIVIGRWDGSEDQAVIAELGGVAAAPDLAIYKLIFTAILHAAEKGVRRLYARRGLQWIEMFRFKDANIDEPLVVYDMTREELNWPEPLRTHDVTHRPD